MAHKFLSYEFNPFYFSEKPEYRSLSATSRLVYRDLLDLCWMSPEKTGMEYDPERLSEQLGMDAEDIDTAVSDLSETAGLIEVIFNFETNSMKIFIPYLETQVETLTGRENRLQAVAIERSLNDSAKVTPLKRVSGSKEALDPMVGYLEDYEVHQQSGEYTNWLPTFDFGTRKQVYYVRSVLTQNLRTYFPGRSIESDLAAIFDYLIQEDAYRPSIGSMNRFIVRWIQREMTRKGSGQMVSEDALDSLDSDFSAFISSENFG